MRVRTAKGIVVGVVGAYIGTLLGSWIYLLCAPGFSLTIRDILFVVPIAISNPIPKIVAGAFLGTCAANLVERISKWTYVSTMVALSIVGGSVVGYEYTINTPHIAQTPAIVSVAAGFSLTSIAFVFMYYRRLTAPLDR